MPKKLWYLLPFLLLILCLLVPGILADRQGKSNEPADLPVAAGDTAMPALSGEESNGDAKESNGDAPATQQAASIPAEAAKEAKETTDANTEGVQEPVPRDPVDNSTKPASNETLTVKVNIAVAGKDGQLLFGPGSVELASEATALDALAATGLDYATSKRYPELVETIAGFSNKGQAGWLYQVNDEVPLVAAGKKEVSANDRVLWWYSNSITDPVPSWEQLT
jgi:hypothetical protein